MKIAMVSSESNPFVKSGGLADVVFSLSKELVKLDNDVSIFLPYYYVIREKFHPDVSKIGDYQINVGWRYQGASVFLTIVDGIKYYLVENHNYFSRPNLYGYCDDGERFAFFTLMVRKIMQEMNIHYDIIHTHDWQCGMLSCLIKEQNQYEEVFKNTRFISTIHNEAFQGMLDRYFVNDYYLLSDELYDNGKLRFKDMFSTLKTSLVYSDAVTTVSKTHRDELLNSENSFGLDNVLEVRKETFKGIVNGVDTVEFNPSIDKYISSHYSVSSITRGKNLNKEALLKYFNLEITNGPVFGLVSRLSWQKGIDLIFNVADKIIANGGYIIILGSGEKSLENRFEDLRNRYPNKVGIYIGYSNEIAHKIYAGSDFYLMPSLFEPCGISQMIAKLYASIPIVRNVGGLKDTVNEYLGDNASNSDGIKFNDFNNEGINYAIDMAFKLYLNNKDFKLVRTNAMKSDHTWKASALEYLTLYKSVR